MKIQELSEARKNPELNPKVSINVKMANYAKANKGKKCYISFTVIDKLGVNPAVSKGSKQYNTPIGDLASINIGEVDENGEIVPYGDPLATIEASE